MLTRCERNKRFAKRKKERLQLASVPSILQLLSVSTLQRTHRSKCLQVTLSCWVSVFAWVSWVKMIT